MDKQHNTELVIKDIITCMQSYNINDIPYINILALKDTIKQINGYTYEQYVSENNMDEWDVDITIFEENIKKFFKEVCYEYCHQYYTIGNILNPKGYSGYNSRWDCGYTEYEQKYDLHPKGMSDIMKKYYYLKIYLDNHDLEECADNYVEKYVATMSSYSDGYHHKEIDPEWLVYELKMNDDSDPCIMIVSENIVQDYIDSWGSDSEENESD